MIRTTLLAAVALAALSGPAVAQGADPATETRVREI